MCANMRSELVSGPLYKYPCFVIESACERVISSSMRSTSASISYISSFSSFDGMPLQKCANKIIESVSGGSGKMAKIKCNIYFDFTLANRGMFRCTHCICNKPNGHSIDTYAMLAS